MSYRYLKQRRNNIIFCLKLECSFSLYFHPSFLSIIFFKDTKLIFYIIALMNIAISIVGNKILKRGQDLTFTMLDNQRLKFWGTNNYQASFTLIEKDPSNNLINSGGPSALSTSTPFKESIFNLQALLKSPQNLKTKIPLSNFYRYLYNLLIQKQKSIVEQV